MEVANGEPAPAESTGVELVGAATVRFRSIITNEPLDEQKFQTPDGTWPYLLNLSLVFQFDDQPPAAIVEMGWLTSEREYNAVRDHLVIRQPDGHLRLHFVGEETFRDEVLQVIRRRDKLLDDLFVDIRQMPFHWVNPERPFPYPWLDRTTPFKKAHQLVEQFKPWG